MPRSNEKPDIILINCDDLGYGDLGCYGSSVNKTPALDRLAAEGIRFTDFYMASPVCSPSRGAMMTGCYPPRIGFSQFEGRWVLFPGQGVGLNPDETTIAKLLKEQGYATSIIGKWHCGDQPDFLPTRHGFDRYYGIPFSNDMGIMQKNPNYPPLPLMDDEDIIQQQPDQTALTERYVEESIRFIRTNQHQPFFLYLAHMHVHRPLLVSQRFLQTAENGAYGAAVECIDWATDMLMYEINRLGLDDDTLFIFTSDNGSRGDSGGSNAPLRGAKGSTWEGGMRLPCIMRWTGQIPAGKTCSEIATSLDFYPTLAAIAGAQPPDDRTIDGKDIRPLMFESDAQSPHEAFFYYHQGALEAVRSGDWKLHFARGKERERQLYNLSDDIGETTNLIDQHPEIATELERKSEAIRTELGDTLRQIEGNAVRPIGTVASPKPLTEYDPNHPYMIALYDGDLG